MDNKTGSNAKGDRNKISRLGFLKLLGASAVGYFAFRVGFFNGLFGNEVNTIAAAVGMPPSQPFTSVGKLDEDGILMMATPKPGGYSYRFKPTQNPLHDIRLD